jgi:hypothetical protein
MAWVALRSRSCGPEPPVEGTAATSAGPDILPPVGLLNLSKCQAGGLGVVDGRSGADRLVGSGGQSGQGVGIIGSSAPSSMGTGVSGGVGCSGVQRSRAVDCRRGRGGGAAVVVIAGRRASREGLITGFRGFVFEFALMWDRLGNGGVGFKSGGAAPEIRERYLLRLLACAQNAPRCWRTYHGARGGAGGWLR